MVELRKRPAPPPAPPPAKKKAAPKTKARKDDAAPTETTAAEPPAAAEQPQPSTAAANDPPKTGDQISLSSFGDEIETNEGEKTTLAKLVEASKAGVVLFTYPKASTPGCTTQACLFRDSYTPLTATGLAVYGLSTDTPKANTTFKTKQNLPYALLCDPAASLIQAIGFKKAPKGTQRGVFVVNKEGKVLAVEAGGPAATVEVVKGVVDGMGGEGGDGLEKAEERAVEQEGKEVEDKLRAETAAKVADDAARIDAKM